ncbi:MAG: GPW/gp25 family protein [Rhizobiaceae bacterium]|nr:GPW/gp25 family protein [Rhizobiaceae bacterium]MCC0000970.1 GPW/gp25 family protein [Methylobacteriaceae bacterium]
MATLDPIVDIDRETGELISGWARCRQSIYTILTTRLHTRLMRLRFGSEFSDLIDKPSTDEVFMRSIIAAADAIDKYEPEFMVSSVLIENLGPEGAPQITIVGDYLPEATSRRAQVALS